VRLEPLLEAMEDYRQADVLAKASFDEHMEARPEASDTARRIHEGLGEGRTHLEEEIKELRRIHEPDITLISFWFRLYDGLTNEGD
jgi:hypothetical protein